MRHRNWIILGMLVMILLVIVQFLLLEASRSEALAECLRVTEFIHPIRAISAACLAGAVGAGIAICRHTAEH